MTTLFRAVAYRLQRLDTPADQRQPEVHVFVEAANEAAAGALIVHTLASLWGAPASDVEFYNLHSERELLGSAGFGSAEMGDAALLCVGWSHGPLFAKPEHTLSLVTPRTLERLHRARQLANVWASHQREAARLAAGRTYREAAAASRWAARPQDRAAALRDLTAIDPYMGSRC